MQELEKILEEITASSVYAEVADGYGAMCVTVGTIERIIRKHMNDGWISVEERLPERTPDEKIKNSYKKYLVFIDNIDYWDIDIAVYDLWNDKKWRKFSNTYCEIENVTAWCSLPDPYKKIQEENK